MSYAKASTLINAAVKTPILFDGEGAVFIAPGRFMSRAPAGRYSTGARPRRDPIYTHVTMLRARARSNYPVKRLIISYTGRLLFATGGTRLFQPPRRKGQPSGVVAGVRTRFGRCSVLTSSPFRHSVSRTTSKSLETYVLVDYSKRSPSPTRCPFTPQPYQSPGNVFSLSAPGETATLNVFDRRRTIIISIRFHGLCHVNVVIARYNRNVATT